MMSNRSIMVKMVNPDSMNKDSNPNNLSGKEVIEQPDPMLVTDDAFLGTLHVYIHHAREIQNICIYHKQDVYAKIQLTSDPELSVSTKIINGGGRNPLFDEKLQLDVRTTDCSLKCEIWMLSRVKNYLEDQILGFTLIPLPEIIITGKESFTREFALSSTDLFHSPAGFIQLSLSYVGSSPEVLITSASVTSDANYINLLGMEYDSPNPRELDKVEFPDLNIVKENQLMVSEIFGIQCDGLESPSTESLNVTESDPCLESDAGIHIVECFSAGSVDYSGQLKTDSPASSNSVTGSPEIGAEQCEHILTTQYSPSSLTGAKTMEVRGSEPADCEVESSVGETSAPFVLPPIHINVQPQQMVVQQDIVDMYMKSMQQFTESLAKMKLPVDIESSSKDLANDNSGSGEETPSSKRPGPRVFYGSRAFF